MDAGVLQLAPIVQTAGQPPSQVFEQAVVVDLRDGSIERRTILLQIANEEGQGALVGATAGNRLSFRELQEKVAQVPTQGARLGVGQLGSSGERAVSVLAS